MIHHQLAFSSVAQFSPSLSHLPPICLPSEHIGFSKPTQQPFLLEKACFETPNGQNGHSDKTIHRKLYQVFLKRMSLRMLNVSAKRVKKLRDALQG